VISSARKRPLAIIWCYCRIILFLFHVDTQCVTLAPPSNNLEMLCFNGSTYTTGVGYEGDTCYFTCNTGYELTGSDIRTCQSDASWNGTDTKCRKGE